MEKKITVIKLGGALITDKSTPYIMREDIIENAAKEIKECLDSGLIEGLVLIHGVGSFGHPPVLKYELYKGFKNPGQLMHLSTTQQIVNQLRNKIAEIFQKEDIPINLMHASSMAIGNKMKITFSFFDAMKGYLSLGMVPLIGGDMMYDNGMGFSVCSGDQLSVVISRELKANRLIFATDVAGIYDSDPKINKEALLIREINMDKVEAIIKQLDESKVADASGRMKGKLMTLISIKDLIKSGLDTAIISMMQPNILKNFLEGNDVPATRIYNKN